MRRHKPSGIGTALRRHRTLRRHRPSGDTNPQELQTLRSHKPSGDTNPQELQTLRRHKTLRNCKPLRNCTPSGIANPQETQNPQELHTLRRKYAPSGAAHPQEEVHALKDCAPSGGSTHPPSGIVHPQELHTLLKRKYTLRKCTPSGSRKERARYTTLKTTLRSVEKCASKQAQHPQECLGNPQEVAPGEPQPSGRHGTQAGTGKTCGNPQGPGLTAQDPC
jgi:hypothetical protein